MQNATHEQARNEMIRSGNDVDLVVQRYHSLKRVWGGGVRGKEGKIFSYTPIYGKEFMKYVVINIEINLQKLVQCSCNFVSFLITRTYQNRGG